MNKMEAKQVHRTNSAKRRQLFYIARKAVKAKLAQWIGQDVLTGTNKMFKSIHKEVEPILERMRDADSRLEKIGKKQGTYVFDLSKYQGREYSIGTMEKDIAVENNPFAGLFSKGLDKARNETLATDNAAYQAAVA